MVQVIKLLALRRKQPRDILAEKLSDMNERRALYFFNTPYQNKAYPGPAGLLMKEDRILITTGSRNIINPAGHYASHADSYGYGVLKKYRALLLFVG